MSVEKGIHMECLESRLLPAAGDLDPTFGNGGRVLADVVGHVETEAQKVLVQRDGKVLVAGEARPVGEFTLARFDRDGSPDASFGNNGQVMGAFGDNVSAIALLPNGKFLIAGSDTRTWVARYNRDGTLDASFGVDGVYTEPFGFRETRLVVALAPQPDGQTLLGLWNLEKLVELRRLTADGKIASADRQHQIDLNPAEGYSRPAVTVQPDGRFLVVVGTQIRRHLPDGRLDPSFGQGGAISRRAFPGNTTARSAQADARGGILVSDDADHYARFKANGVLDRSFGDGGVVTLPDGLDTTSRVRRDGRIVVVGVTRGRISPTVVMFRLNRNGTLDTMATQPIDSPDRLGAWTLMRDGGIAVVGQPRQRLPQPRTRS
jgi:uncharacterized delta-60 repeat protein